MKFASFPKFALVSLLAGVFALALSGCGASDNLALTPGNWSMTAVSSSGAAGTFYIGGNLTQNGSTLAGTMLVVSSCIDPSQPVAFTGTVNGKKVTLTSASASGEVIAVTATGTTGSALTGTYSVTGGCDAGDSGTLTATAVPSISATWSGPISGSGGPNVTLAIAFTQAATASSDGTYALTGNVTFTGSSCSINGTVDSSFIAGPYLVVNGTTNEQDGTTGSFTYTQVFLNNPGSPTSMKGTYAVGNDTDELCAGDQDTPTFTKQ
jgi:hypothetical protein